MQQRPVLEDHRTGGLSRAQGTICGGRDDAIRREWLRGAKTIEESQHHHDQGHRSCRRRQGKDGEGRNAAFRIIIWPAQC